MSVTLKFPFMPSLETAELTAVIRDIYLDQCIEKGIIPYQDAFEHQTVTHVTNMIFGEGEMVHWAEDSDSENLHICFTCPVTGAIAKIVQPLNYNAPMNKICVRLWIEHMLITMLELLMFTQMQEQMTMMSDAAKERRGIITKMIHAKKDQLDDAK